MVSRPKRTTGMWGLDIADGRLRLVHVHRQRGRFVLTHAVAMRVSPNAKAVQQAELLRRAIVGSGVSTDQVCVCLPASAGYISVARDGASDEIKPNEDFIVGRWSSTLAGESVSVTGVANRAAAEHGMRVARLAGLEVSQIVLGQVASAAAMGLPASDAPRGARAGFIVSDDQVQFALSEGPILLAGRSMPRKATTAGDADVAEAVTQIYRAMQIDGPATTPETMDVISDPRYAPVLERLSNQLGVRLRRIDPGQTADMTVEADAPKDLSEYALAVGAVLAGRQSLASRMDLLGALTHADEQKPVVRMGFLLWALAVLVLALVGTQVFKRVNKRRQLARLERRYEQLRPQLEQQAKARQMWRQLRPWLGSAHGGDRVEHMRILASITDAFPPADQAYATDMDVTAQPSADLPMVAVSLKGRASASEVLHECVSRMNELPGFEAGAGSRSVVEQAQAYSEKYDIPVLINLTEYSGKQK